MRARFKPALLILLGVLVGLGISPTAVQAATNYFDVTKTVIATGTAYCGSGWKVTGGGVGPLPVNYYGSAYSDEYTITGSFPSNGNAWRATATKVRGVYSSSSGWRFSRSSYSPRVYAVCTR